MWPDLAKFRHFGKIFKVLGNFSRIHLLFGKILNLLWQILCAIGQVFIEVNGQMLNNNPAIWSHWRHVEMTSILNYFFKDLSSTLATFRSIWTRQKFRWRRIRRATFSHPNVRFEIHMVPATEEIAGPWTDRCLERLWSDSGRSWAGLTAPPVGKKLFNIFVRSFLIPRDSVFRQRSWTTIPVKICTLLRSWYSTNRFIPELDSDKNLVKKNSLPVWPIPQTLASSFWYTKTFRLSCNF